MTILLADPALLAAFRRGRREALERVYWEYIDRVEWIVRNGVALSRSGIHVAGLTGADARDLVQETFARAFEDKTRRAYDGQRPYLPFLSTIARNLVIDAARRRGREVAFDELAERSENAPEPELPWSEPETVRAVESYLATLPAELRGVHEQRYVRSRSQEEAARELGLSRQQLRTLERRLRDGLTAWLANQKTGSAVRRMGGGSER